MADEAESTPRPMLLASFSDASPSVPGLDSLLSPAAEDEPRTFASVPLDAGADEDADAEGATPHPRDSFADVDVDADATQTVDAYDVRFSNVPLTAHAPRPSVDSVQGIAPQSRRATIQLGEGSPTHSGSTHRRTGSAASTNSSSALPFILHRLDLQKDEETNNPRHSTGHHLIQEEFDKMHKKELQSESHQANIDWGTSGSISCHVYSLITSVDFWGAVISSEQCHLTRNNIQLTPLDYQGFAAEHPEDLAKAIERGIPDTLRGMMWQLMSVLSLF
jgi:hypothetical protein